MFDIELHGARGQYGRSGCACGTCTEREPLRLGGREQKEDGKAVELHDDDSKFHSQLRRRVYIWA